MTLRRTLQRRAQRKRAKQRKHQPSIPFTCADWVTRAAFEAFKERLRMADIINRTYGD